MLQQYDDITEAILGNAVFTVMKLPKGEPSTFRSQSLAYCMWLTRLIILFICSNNTTALYLSQYHRPILCISIVDLERELCFDE